MGDNDKDENEYSEGDDDEKHDEDADNDEKLSGENTDNYDNTEDENSDDDFQTEELNKKKERNRIQETIAFKMKKSTIDISNNVFCVPSRREENANAYDDR